MLGVQCVLPRTWCNLVWGIEWNMTPRSTHYGLDDVFLVLTQLVKNVYEACHCFQPGECVSSQTLDGLSVVAISYWEGWTQFKTLGDTLGWSLLHALTGNIENEGQWNSCHIYWDSCLIHLSFAKPGEKYLVEP